MMITRRACHFAAKAAFSAARLSRFFSHLDLKQLSACPGLLAVLSGSPVLASSGESGPRASAAYAGVLEGPHSFLRPHRVPAVSADMRSMCCWTRSCRDAGMRVDLCVVDRLPSNRKISVPSFSSAIIHARAGQVEDGKIGPQHPTGALVPYVRARCIKLHVLMMQRCLA